MSPAKKYLLIDSQIIDDVQNIHLVLGKVKKDPHNPLFLEDKPWEPRFDNLYANVLFEEDTGTYRCWYSPFIIDEKTTFTPREKRASISYRNATPTNREMAVCYATSKDGIKWEKPNLGLVEFNGSKKNNIIYRGRQSPEPWTVHGAGVFKDLRDSDSKRRYKMFFRSEKCMAVAFSPDGMNWSSPTDCPEIEAAGDTHNNAFWDPENNKYVGITRLWDPVKRVRLVGRTESTDFLKWTKAVEVLRASPTETHRQTYAMPVFRYADIYLGFVMIINTDTDTVDCELTWSPNTVHWERVCPGTQLIPRGPEGSYDGGCIYAAAYPIFRSDEILLYYGGNNGKHGHWRDGFFCLAHLRPDGFAGMEPINLHETGRIVTKPIQCVGRNLRVSADVDGGMLRVGILDASGFGLEGCELIKSNVTDRVIKWKNGRNLSNFRGKPIRLQFELASAQLYSFSFSER